MSSEKMLGSVPVPASSALILSLHLQVAAGLGDGPCYVCVFPRVLWLAEDSSETWEVPHSPSSVFYHPMAC